METAYFLYCLIGFTSRNMLNYVVRIISTNTYGYKYMVTIKVHTSHTSQGTVDNNLGPDR